VVLPKNEIEERARSTQSIMPEGLVDNLLEKDLVDLVAYLISSGKP
jgi:hypothetical protein